MSPCTVRALATRSLSVVLSVVVVVAIIDVVVVSKQRASLVTCSSLIWVMVPAWLMRRPVPGEALSKRSRQYGTSDLAVA